MMMLGDDCLLWCSHGPVLGRFMGLAFCDGSRVAMVTTSGTHYARPFPQEIVTPAGGAVAALERGSHFIGQWGNA